jgi:hypothetical protein
MVGTAPIGAVLTLLLLLTGCSSPAPAVPPPPGYQARLTRTDQDISAAFDAIDHAPDLPTLARTVLAAAGTVSAASQWLASGGPTPASAARTNDALTATLRQFADELAYLSQQVNQQVICTGSTALNAITTAPSMAALRAEAGALGTPAGAGYRWGGFLPAPRDQVDARMPSGRLVVDRRTGPPGNGVLRVRDDGDTDAVVTLARGGAVVVEVAVRAGQSTQLTGVPDGSYDVYYLTGTDWDDVAHMFGRRCEFHRFTDPSTFSSNPVPGGTAYTSASITVSTTTGPDAPDASAVAPDSLPR